MSACRPACHTVYPTLVWRKLGLVALLVLAIPLSGAVGLEAPGEIIVKYRVGKSAQAEPADNLHAGSGQDVPGQRRQLAVLRHAQDRSALPAVQWQRLWQQIELIRQDRNVLYAEPNYLGHFEGAAAVLPNDPLVSSQWWLPAVSGAQIQALGRGAGVAIAVIDTGVDLTHPDLIASLLDGYNFGDGNATPQDLLGHGTKVAGIIAATLNNNIGVTGLAPEAKILPLKINAADSGTFTSVQLANAIDYAVSRGVQIINLSLTVDNQTQLVRDAIQNALNQGIFVVASAGNQGGAVAFPANMAGVIGVASSDQSNQLAVFSNFGPEITIAAPGVDIFTTALGNGYGSASGTSYSTPMVTAAIADMRSINPALSSSSIVRQLRDHADALVSPINAATNPATYTFGSLNAGAGGNALLPHLQFVLPQLTRADSAEITYDLPPTGTTVHVLVAAQTPLGEFSLLPNGNWAAVVAGQYSPVALSYQNASGASGILFGRNGIFPALALAALPPGEYLIRSALIRADNGQLIGRISSSALRVD